MQCRKLLFTFGPIRFLFIVLSISTGLVSLSRAQSLPPDDLIRYRVETLHIMGYLNIGESQIASKTLLPELYQQNQFSPFWTDSNKINTFITAIATIDADGLEPEDYHYSQILGLQAFLERSKTPNQLIRADLDMLLTDAFILLENHLAFGKVDPKQLDPHWNQTQEINDRDPVSVLQEQLNHSDPSAHLKAIKPQKPIYAKLKTALARYHSIAAAGGWPSFVLEDSLKEGMQNESVISLRQRLTATGDLLSSDSDEKRFDEQLQKAVIQFQHRHGLTPDGIVGPKTLQALNVPVGERIDQIRANLERVRWILHSLPPRFVLVDIAGFRLFLYDNDQEIWTSRIQVGRPYRKTPVFRNEISYLEFNPSWTIPPTILKNDVLPAIKKDNNYLNRHSIKILDQRGQSISPDSINWQDYPSRKFPYVLRQDPVPENPLGRVKFMFPNPHMVYLHDTPAKNLFDSNLRTFSSGCIRVENPLRLAVLLLNDEKKWDYPRLQEIVASQKTTVVHLNSPVPILMLYWTVDVDNNGAVYFRKDIYSRDAAIIKSLKSKLTAVPDDS